jgi:phospholipid/cholesterol/gamma-HCH transport system substrate-binding protein
MAFSGSEIKSGILVVLCFILLTVLTFHVSDFPVFGDNHELKVHFNYVSGLEVNAPVHFAGHSVGKVNSIDIHDGNPAIEVTIEIDKNVPVRTDSQAFVDTLGLLGEKFVALMPGTPQAPLLQAGGSLHGMESVPMHHLISQMNELTNILIPLTQKTNRLLEGHEKDLDAILVNLNATSENLKEMTHDLKLHPWKLLRKGDGKRRRFGVF